MPHNLQCEAIVKFLIPDHPQEDNYPDPDEFKEKEKEWMEQQDRVLACHAAWVEREQLAETDVSRRLPMWWQSKLDFIMMQPSISCRQLLRRRWGQWWRLFLTESQYV